ncbi:hypothetical protein BO79DRAFT_220240 [Aspergillus costaricaensis CBS 115574]|uniref:Uncharacterized protein n=1 Tax=Aspergillus costaricaensis CBS 115574 TaxID=1448317 RepID=A0ACD1I6F8_9EURO|nr:hypothetical protein BO79DRAFT_220240 [Aspergillus costaricaensis CBS 115574]RAK85915.1 hypothetical protein BO79DRAFT_220240 [Aspergillus costaricaensis CBS 115574]
MADSLAIDPSGLWRGKGKREREVRTDGKGERLEMDGVDGGMDTTKKKQRDRQEEGEEGGGGERRDTDRERGRADEVRYSDYTYHGPHPLWRVELGLRDSHNLTFWLADGPLPGLALTVFFEVRLQDYPVTPQG